MTEALSRRTGANGFPLTIGDMVCITRGALCGLRGTVQAFTPRRQCVLVIDGLADGVQIVIGPEALGPSDLTAAHASFPPPPALPREG
jgi:hypothetical protein